MIFFRKTPRVNGLALFLALSICSPLACAKKEYQPPLPSRSLDTLSIPLPPLYFTADGREWIANLQAFVQPIPLEISYSETGFQLEQIHRAGVLEGPAKLHLQSGDHHFTYEVYLKNADKSKVNVVDYRSPKTVNPDSILQHQKILLAKDEWMNIVPVEEGNGYFLEEELSTPAQSGVYYAQKAKPISAYYVQPGSCVAIPLRATYLKNENLYEIEAGPLKDQYGNNIADGSLLVFHYSDGQMVYRREVASYGGQARTLIKADSLKHFSLYAKIDGVISSSLFLKPN